MNSSQGPYFLLTAYFTTGIYTHVLFLVILCFYLLIMCSNLLLISVICMNRSLHEPMYVLLCSLFVNELYGSTALFPFLLLQILSDVHTVSASFCFLQIFCVYTYVCIEFYNLALMSYDRYVAICHPLSYSARMTCRKAVLLVLLAWLCSFLIIVLLIMMVAPLQLCGNTINEVFCLNYSIVKLACADTSANNIYGLFVTFTTVFIPLLLICYTYVRILQVCFSGSRPTRQKAVSTCTPHLASLINFSFGVCFEILQSRFDIKGVHSLVQIVLSLYFLTCPPLLSPLMYGLKMSKIRSFCKRIFSVLNCGSD
ncbi:olfactory receptor 10A6-like [Takifugu flavidus]|uniref:Olfactory receptor n=1 Tax=Takifugu flavidus TaxID=433684 RepID=A0A5C6PCD3_9TELE|nr:olfactory receptor 10A6-like [Takifugu flavidus]TWW76639.1 Olfactory receptor 10T2 [Takifugu flavidus]